MRPPWEAGECGHGRVTGVSVFVWSTIPGVYAGLSFLARARGRGGEREGKGEGEVLASVMEGNDCWRKKIFAFTHSLSHVGAPTSVQRCPW